MTRTRKRSSRSVRQSVISLSLDALTWAAVSVVIAPLVLLVLTGFKREVDARTTPPTLVFGLVLDQYQSAWSSGFELHLVNSIETTVISTLLVLVLSIPAAYALSIRPIKRWRDVLLFLISTRAAPLIGGIIPMYIVVRNLGLLDNIMVLIVLYTAMNVPLATWMLRSYFLEIPFELVEAAQIDGAGLWDEIRSIILPIGAAGIAATALICGIFVWNEYLLAVTLTSTSAVTLPVYVSSFNRVESSSLSAVAAASTLAILPAVLAGWVAQRQLTRGLAFGAIK